MTRTDCFKTVSGGGVTYASFEGYDALGQVGSIQYGNQVTTTYSYWEAASRLRRIRTTRSDGAVLDDVSYAYDDVGNVTGIDDSTDAASTQVLAYDGLDRLETATSTAYGSLQFAYSPTGNILQKEGVSYQYSAIQPHRVTSTSDGGSFSYDANGNMIQDGQRKLSYDFDNRPLYVKMQGATVSFAYDGDGTRVTEGEQERVRPLHREAIRGARRLRRVRRRARETSSPATCASPPCARTDR
jgi:YD repeat-containing protein